MAARSSIAHYRITAKLGAGGMGEVYRAHDTKLNRDVAIKLLPEAFSADAARMARFTREAQALAALNHPNIAQVYGVEDRAIIMELVEGDTLRGPLPLDTALDYARQIADALEAAHEKGIIHRDLKPANIKITPQGIVKLLDFGLAKVSDTVISGSAMSSPTLTIPASESGVILGTAAYMAPEQACGQPVDKRADIWAFGVVLWEMLTGRRMFEGDSLPEVLAGVLKNEPDLEAVPSRVRPLIAACLEKDPRKRLCAAGDWRRLVVEAPPAAPRRAGWWTWAAVGLALGAGAGIGLRLRPGSNSPSPLMRVAEDPPVPLAVAGHGPAIALSPDGTRMVYRAGTPDGRAHLSVRRLDQRTTTDLPGTEDADSIFFSSDSRWVAYVTSQGLFKIGVEGGPRTLLCAKCRDVRGLVWGGDGGLIYGSLRGPLFRLPASGADAIALTRLENGESSHRWPTLSPDGSVVVFAAGRSASAFDSADLTALWLRTGERRTLHTLGSFPRFFPAGELSFIRAGVLYQLPLGRGFQPAGPPRALLSDIASVLSTGGNQFTISDTGIAAYIPGWVDEEHSILAWIGVDRKPLPAAPPDAYMGPRLSQDSRKLAVRLDTPSGPDFHVRDLERGVMTQVTFDGKAKSPAAIWTPDGRFLAFGGEAAGPGVYAVSSDGSSPPRKILETEAAIMPGSFSPDGKWLLLTRGEKFSAAPAEIGREGVRLGKPEALTESGAFPRFSPDGRWIVYSSWVSGRSEIFASRFHGNEARYQISTAGGLTPVWPRGDQVFFSSAQGIMAVRCAAQGETLSCGVPRVWSEQRMTPRSATPTFDVAADGRMLALTPPVEAPMRVHFLFNFGASATRGGG